MVESSDQGETAVATAVEAGIEQARGRGQSLDRTVQRQMESAFGTDFSGVQVHTDAGANSLNEALSARAFTTGHDIFFRQGEYNPSSPNGKELLAHELTHVVQQTGGLHPQLQTKLTVGAANDRYEQEADLMASVVMQRLATHHPSSTTESGDLPGHRVQRACSQCEDESSLVQAKADWTVSQVHSAIVQRGGPTQPPPSSTFWERWGSQIEMLRRMFQEQRYGCWCGPGNVCTAVIDDIDQCCKAHDDAYAAAGVTSGTPGPGMVDMWSIEGFKRTMAADARLVSCTQATKFDLHFYGPSAALFREGVALVFGMRATIALWLFANGF